MSNLISQQLAVEDVKNWFERRKKELGYKGCRNCAHQIKPMRACEWLERGGNGVVHLICPRWERRTDENNNSI